MASASRNQSARVLAILLALVLLVECANVTFVDRNDWSEAWGPLVPHDTFPADCSLCHTSEGWNVLREDFEFDHAKQTGVELRGAHAQAACLRCHNDFGPVAEYAKRGCAGCHIDIHRSQLGTDCTSCHNENTWRPSGLVAEHASTRFPLIGRHAATACVLCHERAPTGDYRGAPLHCDQCHKDDLSRARSPDHQRLGWVSRCGRCHTPSSWGAGGFTHAFFPLTGMHAAIDCSACHQGNTFTPLPRDCFSCHQEERARAPNHQSFPLACEQCHNTSSWRGATFSHRWPLTGRHAALDCSACHKGSVPGPLPTDCIACHRDERARAPNHSAFPLTCEQCHNTSTWKGAVFNHRFPLTGPHRLDCSTCHMGGNTRVFNCLACHEHSRQKMDDKHKEERGYSYDSPSCVRCHPNGKSD